MSRQDFPITFSGQRTLFIDIKRKHDADGIDSPLTPFLLLNEMDLEADATLGNEADVFDTSRATNTGLSENATQLRDKDAKPVFKHLKAGAQFLKSMNVKNTNAVLLWGLPLVAGSRYVWPPEYTKKASIFNEYKTKSDSYAAGTSPLQPFLNANTIVLADDAIAIGKADANNIISGKKAGAAQDDTENRDLKWATPLSDTHLICDFLTKLYPENPKVLYEYGIKMVTSPQKPGLRVSTLLQEAKITIKGSVIGGTLTNIGLADVNVFKGKTILGTPTLVPAGKTFFILKGYSEITVVNTSSTLTAKFTLDRSK
jgi:hypothetical protein